MKDLTPIPLTPIPLKVAGRVVATTPKASSLTLVDVASWFRGESNKVAGMIDKSLPLEAQIIQAQKLQQELMEGAVAALYDPALGATLRESFVRPSIERLMAEVGGAGQKQLKAVLDKLTTPDKTRKWFEPGACFAAGTLVHTKEGLVPIEQIRVGDFVLSKHDSGTGKKAYKRVLNTFAHAPQRVIRVGYRPNSTQNRNFILTCTVNHPFWVKDLGWTRAADLHASLRENWLELANGSSVKAMDTTSVYVSDKPGVGWIPSYGSDTEAPGALWDYVNHRLVANDIESLPEIQHHQIPYNDPQFGTFPEELYLHLPVYNLEVEDFHTYYVGEHGVWVHNTNCGGLNFEVKAGGPALTAEMQAKAFLTRVELEAHLKANNIESGVFLVRADQKSQVGLIEASEIKNWAVFEDGVTGRIVGSDKSRWEYAAVIRHPVNGKLTYISVEGVERSASGLQVFVDRKLAFVKAGNEYEVMQLLNRIAERLEKNPNDRWAFEFKPGIIKDELYAIRQAKDLFDKIRRNDPTIPVLQKKTLLADGTEGFVADERAMARIVAMLGPDEAGSLVALRNVGWSSIFPQNVLTEGAVTTASLTLAQINALLPAARQYWLDAGASAALLNSATFQIADLPTGFAGQTQGKAITLDASGAGWGWFLDSTPTANTEFDAATTAMDFNAPLSSEAFGKLDLLTVLIHELGHIVGLPSTPTASDVMSQYLAPGQRRLPDAVDIAALQAKGSPYFNGNSVTLVAPPATYASALTYSQLHPVAPVVNPTFTNGSFTNAGGTASSASPLHDWEQAGEVSQQSSGTVTLGEAQGSAGQTRLAQAFVLNAKDRFLTFTVNNLALQNNSSADESAPQDAFEVALLNANTGTSLWTGANAGNGIYGGTSALSKTDALLSLQLASSALDASVQERTTSVVSSKLNTDGSRTYLVDLRNIAAGTPVNLSSDTVAEAATVTAVNHAPRLGNQCLNGAY